MIRKAIILTALVTLVSASAYARSGPLQATIAQAPKEKSMIAGSIIWKCEATSCVSASDTSSTSAANACRSLAIALGEVTSFTATKGAFDEAQLKKCNGK
jgi:hypothetical protein